MTAAGRSAHIQRLDYDAILIDDDALTRMTWALAARGAGKRLRAYSSPADFMLESDSPRSIWRQGTRPRGSPPKHTCGPSSESSSPGATGPNRIESLTADHRDDASSHSAEEGIDDLSASG